MLCLQGWKRSSYPRCSWRRLPRNRIYSGTWTSPRCCGKLHWTSSCDSPLHTRLRLDNNTQNGRRVGDCMKRAIVSRSAIFSLCVSAWMCALLTYLTIAAPESQWAFTHEAFRREAIETGRVLKTSVVFASVLRMWWSHREEWQHENKQSRWYFLPSILWNQIQFLCIIFS